jgi:hypothetical protein
MANINESHHEGLSLFQRPQEDTSTLSTEWVTYRPINQLTEGSALEFNIPSTSTQYLDLKRMHLHIKVKITKEDGTPIDQSGDDADSVGVANAPLHTMFSQVDLSLQQQSMNQVGPNYPYKAYLDMLFDTEDKQELINQMFVKDDGGVDMDISDPNSLNQGLFDRYVYTQSGNVVDLIGGLKLDFCQQDRLLLNGVPVNLKLWPSNDTFKLMAKDKSKNYKLKIMDASLKVAIVRVNPGVLIGHANALKEGSALYPYTRSVLKNFAIPAGQFSFTTDDLFQGEVPGRLILGLISSTAMHGDYTKNPFNFKNFGCNYVGFYVNGQSMPNHPLQPNYKDDQFMEAFHTLNKEKKNRIIKINRREYKDGYCLYVIDPRGVYDESRILQRGHTRLELKFTSALPETCTVVVYGKFPALLQIDQSRNVTLE